MLITKSADTMQYLDKIELYDICFELEELSGSMGVVILYIFYIPFSKELDSNHALSSFILILLLFILQFRKRILFTDKRHSCYGKRSVLCASKYKKWYNELENNGLT